MQVNTCLLIVYKCDQNPKSVVYHPFVQLYNMYIHHRQERQALPQLTPYQPTPSLQYYYTYHNSSKNSGSGQFIFLTIN